MEIEIGRGKKGRRAYGFDDIAIVPSRRTRDPDDVDITWKLGPYQFELPLLASAMDGVVSPTTAGIIGKLGGLAVLNLEGSSRATRTPTRCSSGSDPSEGACDPRDAGDLRRAGQGGVDRAADREIKEQKVVVRGVADAAARAAVPRVALDSGLDVLVDPGHRRLR